MPSAVTDIHALPCGASASYVLCSVPYSLNAKAMEAEEAGS